MYLEEIASEVVHIVRSKSQISRYCDPNLYVLAAIVYSGSRSIKSIGYIMNGYFTLNLPTTKTNDWALMSLSSRLQRKINQLFPKKTWEVSQQYEWKATQEFMQTSDFATHILDFQTGKFDALSGYRDTLIIKEFFANSTEQYNEFLKK